jgi:hypothetical protein
MPVYDQFETEPYVFYSGSYNDYIFRDVSSIFQTTNSASLDRRAIGTNSSGLFVTGATGGTEIRNQYSPIMGYEYFKYYRGAGGISFVSRPQIKSSVSLFESYNAIDETFSDSILPNPAEVTLINGGQLIWGRRFTPGAPSPGNIFNTYSSIPLYQETITTDVSACFYICLGDPNIQLPGELMTLTASSVGGSERQNVTDNIWLYSYPFQSRYKNVSKITKKSLFLPTIHVATVSASRLDRFTEAETTNIRLFLNKSPVSSSLLASIGVANYGTIIDSGLYFEGATPSQNFALSPSEEIYKFYYSFGNSTFTDGNANFARYRRKFPEMEPAQAPFALGFAVYGPKPRGFKYGASFHTLQNTRIYYRRNRFGQFRDMLEQRPYTKFFDGTAMLESPVTINFVSGTVDYERAIDYVTNTNPSYDPRDSGFWDYEYRSGQPFYDIDNID